MVKVQTNRIPRLSATNDIKIAAIDYERIIDFIERHMSVHEIANLHEREKGEFILYCWHKDKVLQKLINILDSLLRGECCSHRIVLDDVTHNYETQDIPLIRGLIVERFRKYETN